MNELVLEDFRQIAAEMKEAVERIERAMQQPALSWSEAEAAELLDMSLITLQRLRRDGKISYTRVAGKARYTKKHLEDYLEKNTQKSH